MHRVPSGLQGYVKDDTHSVSWETGTITHFSTMSESVLYLLPVLNGDLPVGMLDRSNARVGPDGIGPRHIPYGVKGSQEGLLQGDYVLDHGSSARESCLS